MILLLWYFLVHFECMSGALSGEPFMVFLVIFVIIGNTLLTRWSVDLHVSSYGNVGCTGCVCVVQCFVRRTQTHIVT